MPFGQRCIEDSVTIPDGHLVLTVDICQEYLDGARGYRVGDDACASWNFSCLFDAQADRLGRRVDKWGRLGEDLPCPT